MNKLKLLTGLVRTYHIDQLLSYYLFNKNKWHLFNLKNNKNYLVRVKSRDFNTINENEIEENYNKYLKAIKNPKVIIDIGANIGCFSIDCSKNFKDCKIYAYEPFKESFDLMNINLKLNKINNVSLECAAITNKNGFVDLGIYDGMFEGNSIGQIWGKATTVEKVKSLKLKEVFSKNSIKHCDLLKLDCEGSEYEILENLDSKIFDKIQNILMEYHSGREEVLRQILENNGFKVVIDRLSPKTGLLIASKKAN